MKIQVMTYALSLPWIAFMIPAQVAMSSLYTERFRRNCPNLKFKLKIREEKKNFPIERMPKNGLLISYALPNTEV